MKNKLMIIVAVIILATFNYGIYSNDQIIDDGKDIFLKLAPVDPRSLMQGDFMSLGYEVANEASKVKFDPMHKRASGKLVVVIDKEKIAKFERFYKGEPLKKGEYLVKFTQWYKFVRVQPDSYFFQEGQAKLFEKAKYGVLRYKGQKYLLVGLADENRKLITNNLKH